MQQYYVKTNKTSVESMIKDLKENGFKVSLSLSKYQIVRETSKYNKYIKWFLKEVYENGSKASTGFRTKREALENINRLRRPLPCGIGMLMTYTKEV